MNQAILILLIVTGCILGIQAACQLNEGQSCILKVVSEDLPKVVQAAQDNKSVKEQCDIANPVIQEMKRCLGFVEDCGQDASSVKDNIQKQEKELAELCGSGSTFGISMLLAAIVTVYHMLQ